MVISLVAAEGLRGNPVADHQEKAIYRAGPQQFAVSDPINRLKNHLSRVHCIS